MVGMVVAVVAGAVIMIAASAIWTLLSTLVVELRQRWTR